MEYLLGVVVAIVVEGVKKYGQTEGFGTMIALLIVSLLGGWAYTSVSYTHLTLPTKRIV